VSVECPMTIRGLYEKCICIGKRSLKAIANATLFLGSWGKCDRKLCTKECRPCLEMPWNISTMTHSSSSSSSSGSESEGHHKNLKKGKKEKKERRDKRKLKHKDKGHKLKHGESSGLNVLGVIQDVHKLEDHKHAGPAGHVPAASMNPQGPHVLGPAHITTMLLSDHHGYNNTHSTSSVHVSGHYNPSVSQSSGFSPSGHRIPMQASDPLPSLHETGLAPFVDADGGSVFIGSAFLRRSVQPCKIAPNVRDSEDFGIFRHINDNAVSPTLSCTLCR